MLNIQLDGVIDDDELRMVFAIDEAASFLMETGFKKPLSKLVMNEKSCLRSTLIDFHCILKSKAAIDQLAEGLENLNILYVMRQYPELMRPLFMNPAKPLTAGIYNVMLLYPEF